MPAAACGSMKYGQRICKTKSPRCAAGGSPPAAFFVQMGGKLKKRLADMSEKSEITGNPDENWYTGDI